jgi:hypothetical protein
METLREWTVRDRIWLGVLIVSLAVGLGLTIFAPI